MEQTVINELKQLKAEERYPSTKVAVAMSGGVDSSVAALLLKKAGFDVIGIFMKIWDAPEGDDAGGKKTCCSLEDSFDARRVARILDIPFYVLDVKSVFEASVINYFVAEYLQGRTPNPCIKCNESIKFQFFLERMLALEIAWMATGHYARISSDHELKRYQLLKGRDPHKDQSYFLFSLQASQLARTIFPVGGLTKPEVRAIAEKAGLPTSQKQESQEICFVPDNDYQHFIQQKIGKELPSEGDIINDSGVVIGRHKGLYGYTIGQRRGLGIAAPRPLYVIRLDLAQNRLVVGEKAALFRTQLTLSQLHWLYGPRPDTPLAVTTKIRYQHEGAKSWLSQNKQGQWQVQFEQPQLSITPGQAAVIYQGDVLLGGGWIE